MCRPRRATDSPIEIDERQLPRKSSLTDFAVAGSAMTRRCSYFRDWFAHRRGRATPSSEPLHSKTRDASTRKVVEAAGLRGGAGLKPFCVVRKPICTSSTRANLCAWSTALLVWGSMRARMAPKLRLNTSTQSVLPDGGAWSKPQNA